jgi:hypothetical protein
VPWTPPGAEGGGGATPQDLVWFGLTLPFFTRRGFQRLAI